MELKEMYEDVISGLYEELKELEDVNTTTSIPGLRVDNKRDITNMKVNIRNHHFIYQRDLKKDKFGLIEDEFIYCAARLNGVLPTINMEQGIETIRTNILIGQPREETRLLPEKLDALSFWQVVELYSRIRQFWDFQNGVGTSDEVIEQLQLMA